MGMLKWVCPPWTSFPMYSGWFVSLLSAKWATMAMATKRSPMTDLSKPEKFDLNSHNLAEEKKQELLRLFPEIRTEGGQIDFDKLKLALGETIDVGKERYGMTWPGKMECFK